MPSYLSSDEAKKDLDDIVEYTYEKFGLQQVLDYIDTLQESMEDLATGAGYYRDITVDGHPVRMTHCQKHYIFGLMQKDDTVIIIAILHERMDLMSRLKKRLQAN